MASATTASYFEVLHENRVLSEVFDASRSHSSRLPEPLAKLSRKLLNSDKKKTSPMVEVKPEGMLFFRVLFPTTFLSICLFTDATTMSNEFTFIMNGKEYPALVRLLSTWTCSTHYTYQSTFLLTADESSNDC